MSETLEEQISKTYIPTGFKTDKHTSIVILSMNRVDDLKACIDSLYKHTTLPFEVIVFDNGSTQPELANYLISIDGKTKSDGNGRVRVIYNAENIGCSCGRKEALKRVSPNTAYIATIDNDIIFTAGWLEELIQAVEKDPKIAAACSKLVNPPVPPDSVARIQLTGGRMEAEDGYFARFLPVDRGKAWDDPTTTQQYNCHWLPGGAMLIKKDVSDQVEHAEGYLNGFEDYDYSLQIRNKGHILVNAPKSILIHNHILSDKEKQEREADYLKYRWNYKTVFESLLVFLERTGLNLIKDSFGSREIPEERWWRGKKDFLQPYPEEYEKITKAYQEMSNQELREHFDRILAYRKGKHSQTQTPPIAKKPDLTAIVENHSRLFRAAFSHYNMHNLARHLEWMLEKEKSNPCEVLKREILQHGAQHGNIIDEFSAKELVESIALTYEKQTITEDKAKALKQLIDESYDVSVTGISKFSTGKQSTTYRVETDKGTFFAKESENADEVYAIKRLHQNGFEFAPAIKKSKNDELYIKTPESGALALFDWREGRLFDGTDGQLRVAGKILGALHKALDPDFPNLKKSNRRPKDLVDILRLALPNVLSLPEPLRITFSKVSPQIVTRLIKLERHFDSFKDALTHNNFNQTSVLFGEKPLLVDYSSLRCDKAALDLASAVLNYCGVWDKGVFKGLNLDAVKTFWKGYLEVNKLRREEIELLYDLVLMKQVELLIFLLSEQNIDQPRVLETLKIIDHALKV